MKCFTNLTDNNRGGQRVLMTTPNYWLKGGVQVYIYNLCRMIDIKSLSIDIYIARSVEDEDFLNSLLSLGDGHNIKLYAGNSSKFNFFCNIVNLCTLMKKNKYDVIHVHTGSLRFQALCLLLGKFFHIKMRIAHSHNAVVNLKLISKYTLMRVIKRISYRISRIVIDLCANNFYACSDLAGIWLFGEKTWNKKGVLQHNGIFLDDFVYDSNARSEFRDKYKIGKDSKVIGLVAYFNKQKNQKYLVEVFKEFQKTEQDSYLVFVGKGENRKSVEDFVANLCLKNVIFVGASTIANKFYSMFDIFVMTSIYEGLPFVAIEAQANGCPCLLSDSITMETNITGSVEFCSLETSTDIWSSKIKTILDENKVQKREIVSKNNMALIRSRGYDLKMSATMIEQKYCSAQGELGQIPGGGY